MSIAARRMQKAANKSVQSIFKYGFEAGTAGTTVSTSLTAAGDTPWGGVGVGSGATLVYDTTRASHGSKSVKLVASSGPTTMRWNSQPSLSGALRYYIWREDYPEGDTIDIWLGSDTATKVCATLVSANGAFRGYTSNTLTSTYATDDSIFPLNRWARVEMAYKIDPADGANGAVRFALYNGESMTAITDSGWITTNLGTAGVTFIRVGKYDSNANTTTSWIDSVAFDPMATNLLGPLGGGTTNVAPVANAGVDQSVTAGSLVTLNGAGSYDLDGSVSSYVWSQVSGTAVTLSSTTSSQPTFTAPTGAGSLVFSLRVIDDQGAQSATDTVSITIATAPTGTPVDDAGSSSIGSANYAVPGGAIFMATNGNDTTGNGTQAAPFATLTKAVAAVPAGGTIVVRAGIYNEGEDTQDGAYPFGVVIGKAVTIQNYPNETVWFDGSVPVTNSWTQNGSVWSCNYDRLFDRSPTFSSGQDDGAGYSTGAGGYFLSQSRPQACWPDMILYDGVQMEQVKALNEVTTGKFYVEGATTTGKWFQATKLHIGSNPSGHQIRYANKCKIITVNGTNASMTFRGIGIRRYATYTAGWGVFYLQGPTILENIWIEDTSASAMFIGGNKSGFTIQKVTARRIGLNFMTTNQADNVMLDRVDLQYCNYSNYNVWGPATRAISVAKTQYITLKNSILSNNNTNCFWVDQTTNTPIAVNCLFENNINRPIDYETSSDGIIANCKFIHNGAVTVFINDGDTTRMWNNTLAENSWGVAGNGGPYGESTTTSVPLVQIGQSSRRYDISMYSYCIDPRLPSSYYTGTPDHQWTINSVEICNNTMARAGANTYAMIIAGNSQDQTRSATRKFLVDVDLHIDSNVYHWGTRKPNYPWAFGNGYQANSTIYQSLSAMQSATDKDDNGIYYANDPLNSNYELIDGSVHAQAQGLPADIAAMIGQPAGTKHIGAFW